MKIKAYLLTSYSKVLAKQVLHCQFFKATYVVRRLLTHCLCSLSAWIQRETVHLPVGVTEVFTACPWRQESCEKLALDTFRFSAEVRMSSTLLLKKLHSFFTTYMNDELNDKRI